MPNPYLPTWEYVPDGEPRVFGDRVYVYGSHDRVACDLFCDFKLKVWSAPVDDLSNWTCHGDIFRTRDGHDSATEVDWSDRELFAPDVVEKDGRYYLYAYIVDSKGCVAVADRPEGPFRLLSKYEYREVPDDPDKLDRGTCIDPGVLVDDDGRVYIYCGFTRSYMAEINADNMYEILDDTYQENIIPKLPEDREDGFFEAASPRKIGDTYYLIYSPNIGSRLAYATSNSPTGPFEYRGYIVDNSVNYPGGNNHGSICNINGQWYIFYHRMTNGTIMSRRGCVERIKVLEDGSIPPVEMTSLGFEASLNPYKQTAAEICCYITIDEDKYSRGGERLGDGLRPMITELDAFNRVVTNIIDTACIGYKYFDFGEDYSSKSMVLALDTAGKGMHSDVVVYIDSPDDGECIGSLHIGPQGGVVKEHVRCVTGRHAVFFKVHADVDGPFAGMFEGRGLFDMKCFVFMK